MTWAAIATILSALAAVIGSLLSRDDNIDNKELDILKEQRDGQIKTTDQADDFWNGC